MIVDGAVVREQGITFGIVIVKPHVMDSSHSCDETRRQLRVIDIFREIPLILAAQDSQGVFEYQGRSDIVRFLASIDSRRIPWMSYSVA